VGTVFQADYAGSIPSRPTRRRAGFWHKSVVNGVHRRPPHRDERREELASAEQQQMHQRRNLYQNGPNTIRTTVEEIPA
jgi:hypothetical protein